MSDTQLHDDTPTNGAHTTSGTRKKSKKVYLLRTDARELTVTFYERLDELFLYNQAVTLKFAIDQGEEFRSQLQGKISTWNGPAVSDKYFESLRAQLLFLSLHQFEAFFALLISPFQDVPDWIFLTEYREDIKHSMDLFYKGRVGTLTGDEVTDMSTFLTWAVYAGFSPTDPNAKEVWEKNLDNIRWIIDRLISAYRDGLLAYNSYKHGVRVMTGSTYFRLRVNDAAGNPTQSGFDRTSPDSIIFLELHKEPTGTSVHETMMHFDPDESFFYLEVMAGLLQNIKRCRLARLKDQPLEGGINIVADLDIQELEAKWAARHFRFTISK